MFNPVDYLLENISWYDPIYNIAWVLFMLLLGNGLRPAQNPARLWLGVLAAPPTLSG